MSLNNMLSPASKNLSSWIQEEVMTGQAEITEKMSEFILELWDLFYQRRGKLDSKYQWPFHSGLDELGGAIHNIHNCLLTGFLKKSTVLDNGAQSNYSFMNKIAL